jgi:hypothetical protein
MKAKFDWKAAYFHIVSLVAVIVLLIAVIAAGHAILRLAFPTLSLNSLEWQQVQSFAAYKRAGGTEGPRGRVAQPIDTSHAVAATSEAELRQAWEEYRSLVVEGERHSGLWGLLETFVTIIVTLPVFWWHRRAAKRLKLIEEPEE